MTSIVNLWRSQAQRYRLQGAICPDCGQVSFPPRARCLACPPPSAYVYAEESPQAWGSAEGLVDQRSGVDSAPAGADELSGGVQLLVIAPLAG